MNFEQRPEGWSRSEDCDKARYLSMRLTFAYNDQSHQKDMRPDDLKPAGLKKSPLLTSVCNQCQVSQDTHNMTPYHRLQGPRAFRLLELLSGSMDDPLVGHLRCYTLDDAEDHYEAVSYSWRGSGFTRDLNCQITCNNISITIEANLWFTLRGIRRSTQPRMLWIDGIWHVENHFLFALMESY
jgi:hypothetical protein